MVKTTNLRLNLDKPNHRKAYEILQNSDKSYSKTIVAALLSFPKMKKIANISLTESEKLSERR